MEEPAEGVFFFMNELHDNGFSLYIHVPFCVHKCPYCDFNTYAVSTVPGEGYVEALLAELDARLAQPEWHERPVQTIFWGGGTPSLLAPELIKRTHLAVRERVSVAPDAEIALEANPGQVSAEFLAGYAQAGVNRISLGAQSFLQRTLKTLGRLHAPADIAAAVIDARSAGIENVSIDLIYGVPNQSLAEWREDLSRALELAPNHLSLYGLTVEQGTPLHAAVARKDIIPVDDELALEMMFTGKQVVTDAGFIHYEVSNFAKPGFESKHNLAYWNGDDYLGLGAGAHSFSRQRASQTGVRWSNVLLPEEYMRRARSSGTAEGWRDSLDRKALMFEFFFLGLRKIAGIKLADFEQLFGEPPHKGYENAIKELVAEGLLELVPSRLDRGLDKSEQRLRISARGLALADSIVARFA